MEKYSIEDLIAKLKYDSHFYPFGYQYNDKKIRDYSSKKIIKEGNYITEKSGGNSIKEETFIKEIMGKIDFVSVMVHEKDNYVNYRLGNRAIFNVDIIVEGDLNGNLFNAFISSF